MEDIVTVDPGSTCLERSRLVLRVARWLERTVVEAPLRVQVRGDERLPTRVFFSVSTAPGNSAERRLDNVPTDCDQLHSAVALSIALAIEATLQHGDSTAPVLPEPSDAARKPSAPMHLELTLLGGPSIGLLTAESWSVTPRVSLAVLPWLEIAISGLATYLEDQKIEGVPGGFSLLLMAVGLDMCVGGETTERLGFFMCAGARGGPLRSRGAIVGRNLDVSEPWWAITGSGQSRFWFSSVFAIGGSVEAALTLGERTFTVRGAPNNRELPRLGLSVTAGPVFRFF